MSQSVDARVLLPGVYSGRNVKLTTQIQLIVMLIMSGALSPGIVSFHNVVVKSRDDFSTEKQGAYGTKEEHCVLTVNS